MHDDPIGVDRDDGEDEPRPASEAESASIAHASRSSSRPDTRDIAGHVTRPESPRGRRPTGTTQASHPWSTGPRAA